MAKKKAYRYPLYLTARAAAGLVNLLPRRMALGFGRLLGKLAFFAVPRQRKATLEHLTIAYGDEKSKAEIRGVARKVFENLGQTAVEILRFKSFAKKGVSGFIDFGDARERYRDLLKEGRGLLSLTAHMGNWELLAGAFALEGFEGAVVGRHIYYEPYNQWILGLRQALGVRTIYREDAARGILSVLRKKQVMGILPDQDIESLEGIFVTFFGRPAYTPVAPVKIALTTGCPIVLNFLVREKDDKLRVILGKVIRPRIEMTREAAIEKYTVLWMQEFEKVIRQYPDQWAWMHNRWKTKPRMVKKEKEAVQTT